MLLQIEVEREADGRWIAEVPELPGTMAYGKTREGAISAAEALSFRVLAERIENGEAIPQVPMLFAVAG
jgi:predicted RNase H-like HicB family nuclease